MLAKGLFMRLYDSQFMRTTAAVQLETSNFPNLFLE